MFSFNTDDMIIQGFISNFSYSYILSDLTIQIQMIR